MYRRLLGLFKVFGFLSLTFLLFQSVRAATVWITKFNSPITPVTGEYLLNTIKAANFKGVSALIVELDTPGGFLETTRKVVKAMLNSKVPVVVYVAPPGARAASAGTFILYASSVAAMAPSTHLGAAHPVFLQGKVKDKVLMEKIVNDTLAWAKNIAELRHRNFQVLKLAILKCKTFTEKQALKLGVIDLIAPNLNYLTKYLQKRLNLKKPLHEVYLKEPFKYKLLKVLTNPNLVYFLLMLGLAGIYFELAHPGAIFPGLIGGLCTVLAFVGLSILPISFGGVLLIALAVVFFILELHTPSHGLLSIAGLVCLIFGTIMLFKPLPAFFELNVYVLGAVLLGVCLTVLGITYLAVKALRKTPISGKESLIGKIGEALTEISPEKPGQVFVEGEIWRAEASTQVRRGEKVKVLRTKGLTLVVVPTSQEHASQEQRK